MDLLDKILDTQREARDHKVQSFKTLFAEEEKVAVKTALAKAKQVEELERLKAKHEQELEALKDKHDRENNRLSGEKEKETQNDQIQKKREADRKANEKQSASESIEEGKLVTSAVDIIKLITDKVAARLEKEYSRNSEKGLGMINTIGAMVGHKVTDKKQEKGKLFLKFGEEVEEERDYKKEYENYHSKPDQIKRRAKRNEARRSLKDRKDIKGKDVHHKDNNPMNNDKSNLSIVSQNYNRKEPRLRNKLKEKGCLPNDKKRK